MDDEPAEGDDPFGAPADGDDPFQTRDS